MTRLSEIYSKEYIQQELAKNELLKAGEGSRGGRVVGHTKSGKPIYANHNHASYKSFTPAEHREVADYHDSTQKRFESEARTSGKDSWLKHAESHFEAAAHHRNQAEEKEKDSNFHKTRANKDNDVKKSEDLNIVTIADYSNSNLVKSFINLDLVKAKGEGSRGGHVIGHTKSGKAIYENANHPKHKDFSVEDHNEAIEAHQKPRDEYHRSNDFSKEGKEKNHFHFEQQKEHIAKKNGLIVKQEADQKKKQIEHHGKMAAFHNDIAAHIREKYPNEGLNDSFREAWQYHADKADHHKKRSIELGK